MRRSRVIALILLAPLPASRPAPCNDWLAPRWPLRSSVTRWLMLLRGAPRISVVDAEPDPHHQRARQARRAARAHRRKSARVTNQMHVAMYCDGERPAQHDVDAAERALQDEARRKGVALSNRQEVVRHDLKLDRPVWRLAYDYEPAG